MFVHPTEPALTVIGLRRDALPSRRQRRWHLAPTNLALRAHSGTPRFADAPAFDASGRIRDDSRCDIGPFAGSRSVHRSGGSVRCESTSTTATGTSCPCTCGPPPFLFFLDGDAITGVGRCQPSAREGTWFHKETSE